MVIGISKAAWEVILLGIPLIALLAFGVFHLDEGFTSGKKRTAGTPSPVPPNERPCKSMCSDPDGRPWDDNK